ncbi:thioredoxin domain-containing protein [Aristophania vespae]|uniref:Thioredoxin domain-containing protein n=1 Tax=Aristophania vespae TaxID=2697033 RepID=A0A6P1NEZ5_9PROT|nr:DsbA family protein [Aristophania vespae]QHI96119.1 thioredoxin domain-containing protein [Aristophania vespae]UMM63895.1 hypothetical protein DM15PD_08740 [Aristophania vespae]
MKRQILLTVLAAFWTASLGGSAHAAQTESRHFTPQERKEIVQIVSQALKKDPQILSDAIQSLRQQATEEMQERGLKAVKAHYSALEAAPPYAVKGNPQGKVTVIEFLDPRCGYCRHMMPVLDKFLKRHPDVKLIEKLVPVLGPASLLDVQAIFAAAMQNHYEQMRLALMKETAKSDQGKIETLAKEQGLDLEKFRKDMKGPAVKALIAINVGQAQAIGLDGTPTFIFGQAAVIPGAISLDQLDQILEKVR